MNYARTFKTRIAASAMAIVTAAGMMSMTSCATRTQEGALIGGLGGAALGAAVADDAGTGAVVGGAGGAVAGGLIGNAMDRRDARRYHRY